MDQEDLTTEQAMPSTTNQENTVTNVSNKPDILSDVFAFPWVPFKSSDDPSQYEVMGARGSVIRLLVLVIFNGIAAVVGLVTIIGGNPFIALADDLAYLPFDVAFVFLILVSFLVHTTAHFLCFRAVSGKGTLIAHSYLEAVSSTNFMLLFWLAIAVLYITRSRGIDNVIIVLGGLYLLFPSIMSLNVIHRLSPGRTIVGFILAIIASVPPFVLYLYLFSFLRRARPYEIYDWRSMIIFGGMLFVAIFVLTYMACQQKLIANYPNGVPIQVPFGKMVKTKWVQMPLLTVLVTLVIFFFLDLQYPSLNQDQVPPHKFVAGDKVYNPIHNESYRLTYIGIPNPIRPTGKVGLIVDRGGKEIVSEREGIVQDQPTVKSIAVHPNGEFIFLLADNFIEVLDVASLELVHTIRFGGKIRNLAFSDDGKTLYILDELWDRVKVVPSPVQ